MKLLLDTHALLWWWSDPTRLPTATLHALTAPDHQIFCSAVSAYEISLKSTLGKLHVPPELLDRFEDAVAGERWTPLPITLTHSLRAGSLDVPHRDPFDRLLAAQALIERATLVTADPAFTPFPGLPLLWNNRPTYP
jgi:PIN domain nuclease of toxin-antitoxin system